MKIEKKISSKRVKVLQSLPKREFHAWHIAQTICSRRIRGPQAVCTVSVLLNFDSGYTLKNLKSRLSTLLTYYTL